ncbi:prepilin-type N-terminal cleavage/methylation domain-containing protein [Halalkalibacter okhensis]|uniref:prepilin-type N-terminal cleavage/methylation domain-containing protein n=1 Tax=Halalkalibacter okhensis TaxID=333138 RepID=UPI00068EAA8B|nr:prepilin-type N-terminal cleavage/methylation domain-containing protein [Halalkalibacter okhensis]
MIIKLLITLRKRFEEKGLTLLEVLVVVVIVGIISAIAVPSVLGIIDKAEQDVCDVNAFQLERMYETFLALEDIDHSESAFTQYMHEQGIEPCEWCEFAYVEGEVVCSAEVEEDEDGGVPFL